MVYIELLIEQGRYVISEVGQTSNLRERRKSESYQNSHLKSVIRLEEVALPVAIALREEYLNLVRWIIDPSNGVESPIRRLFTPLTLIDSKDKFQDFRARGRHFHGKTMKMWKVDVIAHHLGRGRSASVSGKGRRQR